MIIIDLQYQERTCAGITVKFIQKFIKVKLTDSEINLKIIPVFEI
jgi:hypothetical protein